MKRITIAASLVLSSALAAGAVSAQSAPKAMPMKEATAGLLAQATVTPDSARTIALARVAKGRIAQQEIEMEKGKLLYSFDIKVPGRSGIEEVQIDAKSGEFIGREHEGPKKEAAERAKEAHSMGKAKGKPGASKARDEKATRPSR